MPALSISCLTAGYFPSRPAIKTRCKFLNSINSSASPRQIVRLSQSRAVLKHASKQRFFQLLVSIRFWPTSITAVSYNFPRNTATMFRSAVLVFFTLLAVVSAQQVGTLTAEAHPSLSWQTCTAAGSCTTNAGSITLDANWRWLHTTT